MRVFLLGGTGSIGAPVLRALLRRAHEVVALARSDTSAGTLARHGAKVLRGDIAAPQGWLQGLPAIDGVIHLACDFASDMQAVDRGLLDALLPHLARQPAKARFLYTGGCWLYGATGDQVATEDTPFAPLAAFAWMVPHLRRVLDSDDVDGIVVHPAMVYGGEGGVFRRFAHDARSGAVRVVGGEAVRWPLVHCDDLAELYALALETAPSRSSYIGTAIDGMPVGRLARAFDAPDLLILPPDAIAAELGEWARGYACDQQLSGARARRELGWQPTHLDPIADIHQWVRQ
jgi:nucleoside-diphosphate-sugar epimerase